MSYSKFKKEVEAEFSSLGDEAANCDLEDLKTRIRDASKIVFERWMTSGEYVGLVSWFTQNFDSGGGDEFLNPLGKALEDDADRDLLRDLYRSTINSRERSYWSWSEQTAAKGAQERVSTLKTETVDAFQGYLRVLQRMGPQSELDQVKTAFERFSAGKRSNLKRK